MMQEKTYKHMSSNYVNGLDILKFSLVSRNCSIGAHSLDWVRRWVAAADCPTMISRSSTPLIQHRCMYATMGFDIPTPASRGLCENCARFNWLYQLTRHLPDHEKDALCQHEDTLVKQALDDRIADVDGACKEGQDKEYLNITWYRISNAPYNGIYFISSDNDRKMLKLGSRYISETPPSDCSICRLLSSVGYAAKVPRPLSTELICYFFDPQDDIFDNYDPPVLRIHFQHEELERTYPYGFDLSLLREETIASFGRLKLNQSEIDLPILRDWVEDCRSHHGNCWRGLPDAQMHRWQASEY
jgi:hypothetical protein